MSQPNILELIKDASMEWKKLGEVTALRRGRVISKSYLADNAGEYPVYSSQTANNGEIGSIDTFDFDGEFISWTTDGANAGTVFHRKGKFSVTNVCGLITIQDETALNYKFLYYWLTTEAKKHVYAGMGNPKLMSHQVEGIPIPIPPLAIQQEIVRILDAMTAVTSELTSELTAREKQYNYYRDQILSFDENKVEWKTLNKLTSRTSNIRWQETDDTYQYIDLSSVSIESNSIVQTTEIDTLNAPSRAQKLVQENDVIFATTRPTQMRICLIPNEYDGSIASTGYCVLRVNQTSIQQKVLPKWIYHCLTSTRFKYYLEENQSGSAYPAISDTKLKEFSIPVPSIEEQARIVAILDKFDTLTHSISQGLPREIELRQKQYEYYRDLLLSFPKPNKEAAA